MGSKPIKRNEHILPLSKDHHFSLLFCWKIRQGVSNGVDLERIKKYVLYFWQKNMEGHFVQEERILFTPIHDDKVAKAISDHRQIKELIDQLIKPSLSKDLKKQLVEIANRIDAHVRFEERELFPHLEQLLTSAELKTIGEQLRDEAKTQDDYADEFWKIGQ